jgi:hypothetical protein
MQPFGGATASVSRRSSDEAARSALLILPTRSGWPERVVAVPVISGVEEGGTPGRVGRRTDGGLRGDEWQAEGVPQGPPRAREGRRGARARPALARLPSLARLLPDRRRPRRRGGGHRGHGSREHRDDEADLRGRLARGGGAERARSSCGSSPRRGSGSDLGRSKQQVTDARAETWAAFWAALRPVIGRHGAERPGPKTSQPCGKLTRGQRPVTRQATPYKQEVAGSIPAPPTPARSPAPLRGATALALYCVVRRAARVVLAMEEDRQPG